MTKKLTGYRFYLEYEDAKHRRKGTRKNFGEHSGSVVATFGSLYLGSSVYIYEAIAGVIGGENPPPCSTSVSPEYLSERCLRISQKQAREIHPALFEYLDKEY